MSTSDYQSWLQLTEDREYRTAHPHAKVLQQLFSNTIDSTTAVKELSLLDFINENTPWALWGLIYEAAADFPSSHSLLLALLIEAEKLDSKLPESVLQDIPREWSGCFGSMWRDKWDIISPHALSGWTVSASKSVTRWINMNTFSARLLATTSFSRGAKLRPLGLSLLTKCLEADPMKYKEGRRQAQSGLQRHSPWYKMDVSELLAADVCAAAQWIIYAGVLMWKDDRPDSPEYIQRVLPGKTDLWDGSHGFTEGRWRLWKERFLFMAEYEDISPDAQQVARKAGQIMGEFL
ncbi:uncharacterized protein N7479_005462 [Penicillium vulpinum]|uniref:Uncharacterized protein n=1 Tax=Penicillium vulpinum TaxID=29845 RepID=A0A1V6SET1_9EURO|nr:uncharacterized protein N7479_005462 [Penicillium vulpinum]KAJ5958312.1 hypothetical protein N7479_005462 [Penicillium vulpinum]OQE12512.1 hypothetical protein PENVUL_c001G03803 [Penicillium vulpinum]